MPDYSNYLTSGLAANVTCTRGRDGRVTVNWPEWANATVISRQLLDEMVAEKNSRYWIPVGEPMPGEGERVLVFDKEFCQAEMGTYYAAHGWVGDEIPMLNPSHWMPLPEPPEATL